jgi:tetratricopeptide (TPR) repeat protein
MLNSKKTSRYEDGAANLQKSILAYQATLLQLEPHRDAEYAAIHNNLGTTYWHLAQYSQPLLHLKQAIASYQEALDYFQQQTDQLAYAMLQNNLGTAYWNLAQYEPSVNLLEKAIASYQEALKYRTAKTAPAASAATQNNLGTAYWHLANQLNDNCQIRTEYLEKAIIAYETALTISQNLNPHQLSFDLLATANNLGLAHYQLATDPYCQIEADQKIEHLQSGLRYHLQVLQKSPTVPNKSESTAQSNSYQTALSYIVKIVRAFYSIEGITGQNLALSQIPGQLLPEVLRRL